MGNFIINPVHVADLAHFNGNIENGFCWDSLSKERMKNPKSLESYGYKVYSQNDEDGIIHEIFSRIGTTNKKFIEFGVQDGLESNTHLLLFYGWNGLWIEGSNEFCNTIQTKFKPVIATGQLKIKNAFITKENINALFSESGFTDEIDLLSIDIDGNDWYVWESINVVNPRVVIAEYNGKFPPDLEWCQAYNPEHVWDGSDWHGASLKAFEKLGRKKGYRLVGTDLRGCNAFFVRNDLSKDLFYEDDTAEALYNPLRCGLSFITNHPAKYCLALQKDGLGLLNYQNYELLDGFHKTEITGNQAHVWTSKEESKLRILLSKGTSNLKIPYSIPTEVLKAYTETGGGIRLFLNQSRPEEKNFQKLIRQEFLILFLTVFVLNTLYWILKFTQKPGRLQKYCKARTVGHWELICSFQKYFKANGSAVYA